MGINQTKNVYESHWRDGSDVYVRCNHTIIHKEGAFIDCVNCTECLLNGLAGLVTGLPDGEGYCHAVGSSEFLKPKAETIIVSHEFDYGEMKFQRLASTPQFYVKDNLKRTLAYVTLTECKEQKPLLLTITNSERPELCHQHLPIPMWIGHPGGECLGDQRRQKG